MTVRAQQPDGAVWERVIGALRGQGAGAEPVCAYVYDLGTLLAKLDAVRAALTGRCELYYAIKANGHPAVLSTVAAHVEGFEVASLGEVGKAVAAGTSRLVFSGPAKTDAQIAGALEAGLDLLGAPVRHGKN